MLLVLAHLHDHTRLWGTRIGAVALEAGESTFQYDPEFVAQAGVPESWRRQIGDTHRLDFPPG